MRTALKRLLLIALLASPGIALAGPWCLVRDALENCNLPSAEACYDRSNRQGGYCKPNPRELGIAGGSTYCVVSGTGRRCTFRSRGICLAVARSVQGGCVRNTERDLARRAAGEKRIEANEFEELGSLDAGSLESAGYGSGDAGGGF